MNQGVERTGVLRAVLTTRLVLKLFPNEFFLKVYQSQLCSIVRSSFICFKLIAILLWEINSSGFQLTSYHITVQLSGNEKKKALSYAHNFGTRVLATREASSSFGSLESSPTSQGIKEICRWEVLYVPVRKWFHHSHSWANAQNPHMATSTCERVQKMSST